VKNILIVGAHPDDIDFGAGGLSSLSAKMNAGFSVSWLVMTRGEAGGDPKTRVKEQERSAKLCGVDISERSYQFQDTRLAEAGVRLIDVIEQAISDIEVVDLFLPFPEDIHQDHRALSVAGLVAGRWTDSIFFYESFRTGSEFSPTIFLVLSDKDVENKGAMLNCHKSQLKPVGSFDDIIAASKATARFRGRQAGAENAEAYRPFRMTRRVWT